LQDLRYAFRLLLKSPAFAATAAPVEALAAELAALDPRLPRYPAKSMEQYLGLAVMPARVASVLFAAFGLLGVALASLGLYRVVA